MKRESTRLSLIVINVALIAMSVTLPAQAEQTNPSTAAANDSKLTKVIFPDTSGVIWNAVLYPTSSVDFCDYSDKAVLSGMGDPHGNPLELRYIDSFEPRSFQLPSGEKNKDLSAWTVWNKSFVEALNTSLINEKPISAEDKLVVASVSFDVVRSKKIQNLVVSNFSGSPDFEKLVRQTLRNVRVPEFPTGCNLKKIHKRGRFSQNYGPGVLTKL